MDDVAARRDALRQAATAPGADPRELLEAALTELDGTVDALIEAEADDPPLGGASDTLRAERRLLQAAFQQAPAALLLLAASGTIRRASNRAAALLGAPVGYATGKPLTVFIDLPQRAAVQTQLAAVARTGDERHAACRMLTPGGLTDVTLAVCAITLPGDPPVLVAAITQDAVTQAATTHAATTQAATTQDASARADREATPERPRPEPGEARPGEAQSCGAQSGAAQAGDARSGDVPLDGRRVAAMTRRLDMVTAVTRLLLDNSAFSEAVTVQRFARLLAGEFANWVIVDLAAEGGLRRQVAAGPRGPGGDTMAGIVRGVAPGPSTLPGQVHASGKPVLLAHAADPAVLGAGADGTPLLMTLRATSLLVVPIADEAGSYGTLTLLRQASAGRFTVADLGLAEDLGEHLATALRVDQLFRREAERAEALRASLLPERLPEIPGLDLAASYIDATKGHEIGGDFYDVFAVPSGWALAIGDVSGIGQQAAALTAATRHSIRALAHVHTDPADVLAAVSEVLLAADNGERYVTGMLAFPEVAGGPGNHGPASRSGSRGPDARGPGRSWRMRLASAGHPGPAVVRADGRVDILAGDGLPLGLLPPGWLPDARPVRMDIELGPGDVLLLYTDGVSQAKSENSEFFDDRLADALAATAGRSATEMVRSISEELTDFCRGEFRDDVTMLAMRVSTD
jgi:serine phosphatase RsbU (regulator of sigma subunit)/PAS domain-containing protein